MLFACSPCMQTHTQWRRSQSKNEHRNGVYECVYRLRSFDQILVRIVKRSFPPFVQRINNRKKNLILPWAINLSASAYAIIKDSHHKRWSVKMNSPTAVYKVFCCCFLNYYNFIKWKFQANMTAFSIFIFDQSITLFYFLNEINITLSDRYLSLSLLLETNTHNENGKLEKLKTEWISKFKFLKCEKKQKSPCMNGYFFLSLPKFFLWF